MHTHALTASLTLYRSGTLSLSQAAHRAGYSETEMRRALSAHGIPIREDQPPTSAIGYVAGAD